nr:spore germination protein [uncultured Paenibacillus sp.]
MFKRLIRLLFRAHKKKQPAGSPQNGANPQQNELSTALNENLAVLQTIYQNCPDVIFRRFSAGGKTNAILIYVDGLSNIEEIDQNVLSPLMHHAGEKINIRMVLEQTISVSNVKLIQTVSDVIEDISLGNPVILIDQQSTGFALGLAKFEKRSIEEPKAESAVRGPREGFTEVLPINVSLLRRKIRSPELKFKTMKIGRYTRTQVMIGYIEGIADETLITEVAKRLEKIDIDGVLESGYIEELVEDNPWSPFPQVLSTERPDVVSANLLEGRVVVLTDGTPFALIAPTTFYSLFQAAEDYYQRFWLSTAIRWMRYAFFLLSLLLPSAYIAVLTFHQEMVPTNLVFSIAKAREEVPFPALIEALIMEVIFEALREAGIRLPKQVGAAVSIVGALVIGEAAVSAGLISAPMVMAVSITGIASFTIPRYAAGIAFRMLRFPLMILAATFGLLGIMVGLLAIIVHLNSLRSFGVPYLSPMAPMKGREMKDVLIRAPWWMMNTRPHLTGKYNKYRQSPGQKPDPKTGDER